MINLLPPQAKALLKREQRLRFLSVLLMAAALALLVFSLLSIPTFVMQREQINNVRQDAKLASAVEAEKKSDAAKAEDAAVVLAYIERSGKPLPYLNLIAQIDTIAGADVNVNRLQFDGDELLIGGVATTRGALSSFHGRLKETEEFSSVELPLSNLVAEQNPTFSITLEIK